MSWLGRFIDAWIEEGERERKRALAVGLIKYINKTQDGFACNFCFESYQGLAGDCRCTKYGYSSWREAPRKQRPWYWKLWPERKET